MLTPRSRCPCLCSPAPAPPLLPLNPALRGKYKAQKSGSTTPSPLTGRLGFSVKGAKFTARSKLGSTAIMVAKANKFAVVVSAWGQGLLKEIKNGARAAHKVALPPSRASRARPSRCRAQGWKY